MEIIEPNDSNSLKYSQALMRFREWPLVEELGRPAGHTSQYIQELIHDSVGSSPGDPLSQQYVTPDPMTARGIFIVAQEAGVPPETIDSIFDTLTELELYKANPAGEYPAPLSSYSQDEVMAVRQGFAEKFKA